MASPLVVPVSGYSTLSRFESEISRSPTLTTVPALILRPYAPDGSRGLADPARLRRRLRLADHLELRPAGGVTAACRLCGFDAGLQRSHQVDDLRCCGRWRGSLEQLAGRLPLDQVEDLLAIRVF